MRCLLFVTLVGHAAGAESGSGSAYNLSSTAWRVLNAEQVGCQGTSHDAGWHVYELDMLDENGLSTRPLIRNVQTSSDYYDITRRAVLHDGDFHHIESDDNCGANCVYRDDTGKNWHNVPGDDGHEACRAWIGYTFERPVAIRGVHMSQVNWWPQQVEILSLEAWVDGSSWQHVAYVHLASQNQLSNFVGRMDYQDFPGQSPPAQCKQFKTGRVCVDYVPDPPRTPIGLIIGIAGGVIVALASLATMLRRKHLRQGQDPVGRPLPPQQVVPMQPMQPMQAVQPVQAVQAVPMQPAVAVGTAVPMQPAASNVMIICPPGLKPGDPMQVSGPGGQAMQVYVPPGTVPGGQFVVQMPAAPAVVQSGFFLA